jgi:hypothetical protein
MHQVRDSSPSARSVQHLNGIGGKARGVCRLHRGRQSIDKASGKFLRRRLIRRCEIRWRRNLRDRRVTFLERRLNTAANPRLSQIPHPLPVRSPRRNSPGKSNFVAPARGPQIRRRLRQLQRRRERRPDLSAPAQPNQTAQPQQEMSSENRHAQKQQTQSVTVAKRAYPVFLTDPCG